MMSSAPGERQPCKILDHRETAKQLLRFAIIGLTTNIIGYCFYLLMTSWIGIGPKTTVSILYPLAALLGFIGNRQWTFSHQGNLLGSSLRYLVAHTLGYSLNILLLVFFVDQLHLPHQLVQAAAIVVVALFLFVMFRIFVFPAHPMLTGKSS